MSLTQICWLLAVLWALACGGAIAGQGSDAGDAGASSAPPPPLEGGITSHLMTRSSPMFIDRIEFLNFDQSRNFLFVAALMMPSSCPRAFLAAVVSSQAPLMVTVMTGPAWAVTSISG